jgi:prepilin-type N-terminal cleavage/methylation domain-containing protein
MSSRDARGYTLIEIAIVIAIISLMAAGVLAFVSSAQKSSRDGQRRDAVAKAQIAMEQWASTHSGTYLSGSNTVSLAQLYSGGYLGADVKPPGLGGTYTDDGNTTVSGGELVIRDRNGGTTGFGYCLMVLLEAGNVYGATDNNKSGRTITNTASCT